jgi:ArsR family transcriptional regulator
MQDLPVIDCCPALWSTLDDDTAADLARVMKTIADPARLKIISVLMRTGNEPRTQAEFEPVLSLKQPTVSYHLGQLAKAGILTREKRGTSAYFSLTPGALNRIREIFAEPASA